MAAFRLIKAKNRPMIVYLSAIDTGGDIVAGVFLSHLMQSEQIEKNGKLWTVKTLHDWFCDTRLTARQVRRCITKLENEGFIEHAIYKYKGSPVTHLRLTEFALDMINT